jgi:hypothetical protein
MTREERALLRTVRRLARRPAAERRWVVRRLSVPEKRTLAEFWPAWLHAGQAPPAGEWAVWLMLTGRGFGKTRAGAEWVSALARADGALRIALVGATIEDALKVMVTGQSGVMRVARTGEAVILNKSERLVRFASGAEARLYSGRARRNCAGPSIISPGATRSPNGGTRRRRGTICSSGCGWALRRAQDRGARRGRW